MNKEENIEKELEDPTKVKYEIKQDGKWVEVPVSFFKALKDLEEGKVVDIDKALNEKPE